MQFITAALMTASVVFAHPLYTRQDCERAETNAEARALAELCLPNTLY